ncbi:MAG: DUF2461 domain-containing protein [Pseudomonadota bacterium]
MTSFDSFSPGALRFLADLSENNEKAWFEAHRAAYEAEIKGPSRAFAAALADTLETMTGRAHGYKVLRIHRDIRFSKDKRPYNAYIRISIAPFQGGANDPAWFFGVDPVALSLGCGVFQFDKTGLLAFRDRVAGDRGGALDQTVTGLEATGHRISPPELKRVPSGYDKDHPRAALLRRKGLTAWADHPATPFATAPGLVPRVREAFERLQPLFAALSDGT